MINLYRIDSEVLTAVITRAVFPPDATTSMFFLHYSFG